MYYLIVKFSITAALIVAISEIAKRSSMLGGLLASLPLVSILAFLWLYIESGDTQKVADLASSILWLVLPSLVLFLLLPALLKRGMGFYESLATSCLATAMAYVLMLQVLRFFKVQL